MISLDRAWRNVFTRSIWLYFVIGFVFAVTVDFKTAAKERTRYLLGVFYNESLSNYTDGIVYFDYLAHRHPDDGRDYFFLGYCYLYLNQYHKALVYFERALRLDPDSQIWAAYLEHARSKAQGKEPAAPLPAGTLAIPTE